MTQRVEIKKGLFGRRSIGYDCTRCKTGLTSPLDDAGKSDICPDCNTVFIVPGVDERDRILQADATEAERHAEQKQAAAAERSERKELARKHRDIERQRREALSAIEQQVPANKPTILDAKPKRSRVGYYALAFFLFAAFLGAIQDGNRNSSTPPTPHTPPPQTTTNNWYEGGTLLEQGALEWQNATYENKLATAADMVSSLVLAKALKPHIQANLDTMEELRVYADEMVDFIDAFTRREPDAELNRKMYTNQTVRDMGALGALTMGWLK